MQPPPKKDHNIPYNIKSIKVTTFLNRLLHDGYHMWSRKTACTSGAPEFTNCLVQFVSLDL